MGEQEPHGVLSQPRGWRWLFSPEVLTISVCALWIGSWFLPASGREILSTVVAFAVMALAVVGTVAACRSAGDGNCRLERLRKQRVEVRNGFLAASDAKGRPLGRIDLGSAYEVTIPWAGNGEGIYRVSQGDVAIEFSSRPPQAEHLVKDVLHHPVWPPDAYLNWL